eukprot:gene5982-biopygen13448
MSRGGCSREHPLRDMKATNGSCFPKSRQLLRAQVGGMYDMFLRSSTQLVRYPYTGWCPHLWKIWENLEKY